MRSTETQGRHSHASPRRDRLPETGWHANPVSPAPGYRSRRRLRPSLVRHRSDSTGPKPSNADRSDNQAPSSHRRDAEETHARNVTGVVTFYTKLPNTDSSSVAAACPATKTPDADRGRRLSPPRYALPGCSESVSA